MAVQISIEQRSAQPVVQEDILTSHDMAPVTVRPPQGETRIESKGEPGGPVVGGPSRATENTTTTAIIVSIAVAAAGALFAAGVLRPHLTRAFHRLMDSAEEIRVPLVLPMVLAELARELISDRQEAFTLMTERRSRK